MLTLMKPKVKPRISGLILGRNVAGPESPSSDSPLHLQAGGGLSAAPLSTTVLRACAPVDLLQQAVAVSSRRSHVRLSTRQLARYDVM